jgi:hypothetical protein
MNNKKKIKPSRRKYIVIILYTPIQTLNFIDFPILFGPFFLLLAVLLDGPGLFHEQSLGFR